MESTVAQLLAGQADEATLDYFCERALLAPRNEDVDAINALILEGFDKMSLTTDESADSIDGSTDAEDALWPLEFLHAQTPSGMPPHHRTVCGLDIPLAS